MAGMDNLTAAQLSNAAYIPKATYIAGNAPADILPSGDWHVDTSLSEVRGNNQFIVFHNDITKQVFVGFKGTDSISQLKSDLMDDGAAQWASLKSAFESQLANIRTNYADYEVMTGGHSSGGGMAQTAALENNLSGWGQNSLPIAQATIDHDPQLNNGQPVGRISGA
jgi:hypothetical protein